MGSGIGDYVTGSYDDVAYDNQGCSTSQCDNGVGMLLVVVVLVALMVVAMVVDL